MLQFGIFTEDGLDQIVETQDLAQQEKSDLVAMGCNAKIVRTDNESRLYHIDELIRAGKSFAAAIRQSAPNPECE